MLRRILLCLKLCSPGRCYTVFRFLITVFLLFRRRPRWLLWRPLSAEQLVVAVRRLGASFLKLAQVLATRADFFDQEYIAALRQLHDQMPAMSHKDQDRVFRRAFPDPEVFADFSMEPLASASIGQVHKARLRGSEQIVAVKLLRADIQFVVRVDIFLLNLFLRLFQPLFSDQTLHSIESVLKAFTRMILQEVSMNQELANLEHFSQVYAHTEVRFPLPYRELSCDAALVMSFEEGVRIDDLEAISAQGVSFPRPDADSGSVLYRADAGQRVLSCRSASW